MIEENIRIQLDRFYNKLEEINLSIKENNRLLKELIYLHRHSDTITEQVIDKTNIAERKSDSTSDPKDLPWYHPDNPFTVGDRPNGMPKITC